MYMEYLVTKFFSMYMDYLVYRIIPASASSSTEDGIFR